MEKNKTLYLLLLMLCIGPQAIGQNGQDFYQSIGKMYVVVTVVATLFVGLAIYLYRLDRKITQLEKKRDL